MVDTNATIAIAGLGAVTGYGWGLGELWKGLMSGKSAAHPIVFDDFVGLAATVPEGGDENDSITLFGRALYGSGREAVVDADNAVGIRDHASGSSCVRRSVRSRDGATSTSSTVVACVAATISSCCHRPRLRCSWPSSASPGRR